jgi:predicted NAD-dependent protein-ADP-ribosyltransferase YbiA (DUF1768 family)
LLKTFPAKLVERTNSDSFWGDGKNRQGENKLGIALMKLR